MQHINRDCLRVVAKQSFVDWLRSVPELEMPDATLDDVNDEETLLLLPEMYNAEEARDYMEAYKADLAESFFWEWDTDRSVWPDLAQQPFDHWFILEYHSVIYDIALGEAIEKDGSDELAAEDEKIDIEPIKELIAAEFDRTGDWGIPQDPNMIAAYRAINNYRRISGDMAGVLDLHLTMVESGTDRTLRLGDLDEVYYESIETVMEEFVALAHAYPEAFMRAGLEKRLKKLVQDASHIGWGYGDTIDELVQEVLRLTDGV